MNLRKVIDELDWRAFPSMSEDISQIALKVGLLPFQGGEIRLEDDYGIIAQRYVQIAKSTLARGWWFNTHEKYTFTPDELAVGGTAFYELPSSDGFPIHVRPIRFADKDCPQSVRIIGQHMLSDGVPNSSYIEVLDDDWDTTKEWYATVVVIPPAGYGEFLPMAFKDYVIAKTAQEVAPYFGAATDPQEQYRTWNELLRAHADAQPAHNMIDDNPINWMTTRRR